MDNPDNNFQSDLTEESIDEKDENFFDKIKIPVLPKDFSKNSKNYKYEFHKKLNENLRYFEKTKKDMYDFYELKGKWFGFWLEDDNEFVVKGNTLEFVVSKSTNSAVISYGTKNLNAKHVYYYKQINTWNKRKYD